MSFSKIISSIASLALGILIGASYTVFDYIDRSISGKYAGLPPAQSNLANAINSTAFFPGGITIHTEFKDKIVLYAPITENGTMNIDCHTITQKITGRIYAPILENLDAKKFFISRGNVRVGSLVNPVPEKASLKLNDADARVLISTLATSSFPSSIGIFYENQDGKPNSIGRISTIGIQNAKAWEQMVSPTISWRHEIVLPPVEPFSFLLRHCPG